MILSSVVICTIRQTVKPCIRQLGLCQPEMITESQVELVLFLVLLLKHPLEAFSPEHILR